MKFSFNVKFNIEPLEEQLDEIAAETVAELANAQIANIRLRVQQGIGLNDAPMKPYSESYARKKGVKKNPRTLLNTGAMLRGLLLERVFKRGDTWVALISITENQKTKALANQQRTPWFGISPNDRKKLTELLRR
jgi:hypothetical protein